MAEHITEAEFEDKVLKRTGCTVVDFYSRHCMPCKKMEPVFEEVAAEQAQRAAFYLMEVNDNFLLARNIGISSFPTCVLFRDGEIVYRVIGPRTKEVFLQELELGFS